MAKKMVRGYTSTREVYKAVKKYDHKQFDVFCTNIYVSGYEDGRESVKAIDIEELIAAVAEVKGVGPALYGRIKEALDAKFQKQEV